MTIKKKNDIININKGVGLLISTGDRVLVKEVDCLGKEVQPSCEIENGGIKMIVAIYAFENQYGGLHGMAHQLIVDVSDIEEAKEWASEESRQVMDSYSCIMESFQAEAESEGLEEDTDEYNEYIEECIQDNIGYQIWEVIDHYADLSTMESDFYNNKEEFVVMHCKEIE